MLERLVKLIELKVKIILFRKLRRWNLKRVGSRAEARGLFTRKKMKIMDNMLTIDFLFTIYYIIFLSLHNCTKLIGRYMMENYEDELYFS